MRAVVLVFLILTSSTSMVVAETATVVVVYDGDTFVVDRYGESVKVKLYGIDAPEPGQPGKGASTRFLRRLVLNAPVALRAIETDVFGRTLAVAVREGKESSINAAVVSNGYAWVNPGACRIDDCEYWKSLELRARRLKMGIWSGFDLVPPWEFRKFPSK